MQVCCMGLAGEHKHVPACSCMRCAWPAGHTHFCAKPSANDLSKLWPVMRFLHVC